MPTAAATGSFTGSVLVGSPTASSVALSVLSPDQGGTAAVQYGTAAGAYDRQSAPEAIAAGQPAVLRLDSLRPDTGYVYRVALQGASGTVLTEEARFHTARTPGSTFRFTLQADSHLDENSDLDLYHRTLANAAADAPDFHVDLGDTFMCEKHSVPLTANDRPAPDQATVDARYASERASFAAVARSAALFLVNGNHDGEAGWMNDGTAQNLPVWATRARQRFFLNPIPDGFYGGDAVAEPVVGQRASYYAWTWGDALFVALDPFWWSTGKVNQDAWSLTLGLRQYRWLEQTLAASTAAFKLVFVHDLVGGLDGQFRGGAEAAPFFEWGGRNADGSWGFAVRRPGWGEPVHDLLRRYAVSAVFHGHDHLYAHQQLDGIVYQEVPQPSARNTSSGPNLAAQYHYTSGTILSSSGHLRVTVSPSRLTCEYVRAWLPAAETGAQRNASVDHSWSLDRR